MSNYIVPLSSLPSISSIADAGAKPAAGAKLEGLPFADILQNAVENIGGTAEQSRASLYDLAVGGSDDLHTGAINALKHSTAVSYASGMASSAIRAYNELMRMSV